MSPLSSLPRVIVVGSLLTACSATQIQQFEQGVENLENSVNAALSAQQRGNSDGSPSDTSEEKTGLVTDYRGVEDTALYQLFRGETYDSNVPTSQQYPRVALTIISTPESHTDWPGLFISEEQAKMMGTQATKYQDIVDNYGGCWDLVATIWSDLNSSKTDKFKWCYPVDQNSEYGGLRFEQFTARTPALDGGSWNTTGTNRTSGPIPPAEPMPSDLAHQKFLDSFTSNFNTRTLNGIMLQSVFDEMNYDYTIYDDRRVWVREFSEAYQ